MNDKLTKEFEKYTGLHWSGGEVGCDAMPTQEYVEWLEEELILEKEIHKIRIDTIIRTTKLYNEGII